MRILTLDAALAGCSAGLVENGVVIAERTDAAGRAVALGGMVERVLLEAGPAFDLVAVTVGPGSFTGLRAALALAQGIGLARAVPVRGVSVGEALAAEAPPGRAFWTAIDTKRGRVFLDREGTIASFDLAGLPMPEGKVAVAGDAAIPVASRLAARDADVQLLAARRPTSRGVALAAMRHPGRPALPLYVDRPEARPGPAGRPAPV